MAEARGDAQEAELEQRAAGEEAQFDRRMAVAEQLAGSTADFDAAEPHPEGLLHRFLGKLGRG